MTPETADRLRELEEQEAFDDLHCPAPDAFGAEWAARLNANPEFRDWAERHVRISPDPDNPGIKESAHGSDRP